ncbi:MAG: hemerythrin domain-containing protein [Pseudomonadota bacterium]
MLKLEERTGLPDALRVLVETLPRSGWDKHPNFNDIIRFWLDRHLMFRDVLDRLRVGSEGYLDGQIDPVAHAQETQRYGGFLLNQLHTHHQVEDQHYFPQLNGLDARISDGFELLDADHNALDGHIHAMADTMNATLQVVSGSEARDRVGTLHTGLIRFHRFLDRHLTDEEELVVPVILTYAPDLR